MFYTAWNCGMWTVIVVLSRHISTWHRVVFAIQTWSLFSSAASDHSTDIVHALHNFQPFYIATLCSAPKFKSGTHTHCNTLLSVYLPGYLCPFWIVSGILHIWACIFALCALKALSAGWLSGRVILCSYWRVCRNCSATVCVPGKDLCWLNMTETWCCVVATLSKAACCFSHPLAGKRKRTVKR